MKKNYFISLVLVITLFSSCKDENKTETKKEEKKENLVEISNGIFTEYYPGKKAIKFQGPQDNKGERHGKWVFKNEAGVELSITLYDHGKKHGHSIVKYPNGAVYYVGEYNQDVKVGVWTTYNEKGDVINEKDFGQK